jgi:predicted secreted hydrolase
MGVKAQSQSSQFNYCITRGVVMHHPQRRYFIQALAMAYALPVSEWAHSALVNYPPVRPRALVFPRDYGAHPEFRTEWWYLTGWLGTGANAIGFQITFFRSRTQHSSDNPSRFAPTQLLFAHAALAIPAEGKLRHADVAGRVGSAGATFSTADTKLRLANWTMERTESDHYQFYIPTDTFTIQLEATPSQAPVLRGNQGFSAKGPSPELASHYYSRPQLNVTAQIKMKEKSSKAKQDSLTKYSGVGWLDHEWSSSLLMSGAVGWDWFGINLLNGGSIMAFRIRDQAGKSLFSEWDRRDSKGRVLESHSNALWEVVSQWSSTRSLAKYPIGWLIRVGNQEFRLQTLMQDQEVDARASTGGFYYEGAVEMSQNQVVIGRGYLELTGYSQAVKL